MAWRSRSPMSGVPLSITSGATASGPARPAAQARANLSLNAISMAGSIQRTRRVPASTGTRFSSVRIGRRDFRRRLHLGHQVVVPLAFDLEVGGGAELDGLDQVMGHVGVDAGLQERVH